MLKSLQQKFNVKVVSGIFGQEMHQLIASAKVIVDIHYYEQSLLETVRISECLSLGKVIVSERSVDQQEHAHLEDIVEFVDQGDANQMIAVIQKFLSNDDLRAKRESEIGSYVQKEKNTFKFYFLRFMLAFDLISFDQF